MHASTKAYLDAHAAAQQEFIDAVAAVQAAMRAVAAIGKHGAHLNGLLFDVQLGESHQFVQGKRLEAEDRAKGLTLRAQAFMDAGRALLLGLHDQNVVATAIGLGAAEDASELTVNCEVVASHFHVDFEALARAVDQHRSTRKTLADSGPAH